MGVLSIYMFCIALFVFLFMKNHLMNLLVMLEFMSITVLFLLILFFSSLGYNYFMLIYFLIILVCEAVMGLILLTGFVRCHGSDYFQTSSNFTC